MAAGTRTWAVYVADDHGTRFGDGNMAMNIPSEFVVGGNDFGWTAVADAPGSIDTLDQRTKPRHVVGVSADGHRAKAIVASVVSNIWGGIASTWVDTKGTVFTVTGYVGEKRTRARKAMTLDGRASGRPAGSATAVALSAAYGGSLTLSLSGVVNLAELWVAYGSKSGAAPTTIGELGGVSTAQMLSLNPKLTAHFDLVTGAWSVGLVLPVSAGDFDSGDAVYVLLFNEATSAPADSDPADLVLGPLAVGA